MKTTIEGWFEQDKHLYIARVVEEYINAKRYENTLIKAWHRRDNKIYMIELPYNSSNPPFSTSLSNITPDFISLN